jgi:adenylylsulfate kinase|tara:strand:- start:12 stop:188 length:177 start_codon:yes stop_codon:yes gene_type:complete
MKILVMGLPGSGKTYLTERLVPLISSAWYIAEKVDFHITDWNLHNPNDVAKGILQWKK